jgi:hypothetical protein
MKLPRRQFLHGRGGCGLPVLPARVVNDSTTHMDLGWPKSVRVMFDAHTQQRGASRRCRQVYDLESSQGGWPFRAQAD